MYIISLLFSLCLSVCILFPLVIFKNHLVMRQLWFLLFCYLKCDTWKVRWRHLWLFFIYCYVIVNMYVHIRNYFYNHVLVSLINFQQPCSGLAAPRTLSRPPLWTCCLTKPRTIWSRHIIYSDIASRPYARQMRDQVIE